MATMQSILEKDKERFLHIAAGAKSSSESVHAAEEELGRMLSIYNEDETSDKIRQAAAMMTDAARSCAGLLDCDGESTIYTRSQYTSSMAKAKKPVMFWILLAAGIVAAAASASVLILLTDMVPPSQNMMIGLGLMAGSLLCLFISGLLSSRTKKKNDEELYAETIPDPEKTYHVLLGLAVGMDRNLARIRSDETLAAKQELLDEKDGMKKEDINLYAQLLEGAYAERDSEYAKEVISDVRFYLHKRKIEAVDYTEDHKVWFDRMPGGRAQTIRPALVMDNTVLKKGLASGE